MRVLISGTTMGDEREFKHTCSRCECVFIYTKRERRQQWNSPLHEFDCPECGSEEDDFVPPKY